MQEFEQSPQPDHKHYVRKVTLPSGKTIEVISFEDEPTTTTTELHVCPECRSELVYPIDWQEAGRTSWEVSLRCPNCEWTLVGVFGEDAIQRFDEILDQGTEELVSDLRELTRANMEEDVERFVAALTADYLLPEDF
ncbi:MAG: hypothetical protein QOE11_3568 [Solirubrobacteraceae bacterium]|nr:hypothetical protein [Solirubrobacteraceae bacterium]